jgi:nicotinamidase-related amidase
MEIDFIPTGQVEVPEIPVQATIELPAGKSAVIVVDMQNDFVKPGGSLVVPAAAGTVANIRALVANARRHEVRVVYTQDTAVENDPEFDIWPEHCRPNTWGWEIVEELAPKPGDTVFRKNRYDGFYGTGLDHYLTRLWKIEHLVIVGTVSNICVLHTAASAGLRWFHVVVPADGISALTPFDQALTLRQVSSLYNGSVLRSTADVHFDSQRKREEIS